MLDLNILIQGEERMYELVSTLLANCHKLAVSAEVWQRYQQRWALFDKRVASVLRDTFFSADKCQFEWQTKSLDQENLIPDPEDDVHFVRLAAAIENSIMVTIDQNLLTGLQNQNFPNKYHFRVLGPDEALSLAQVPSS